MEVGSWKEVSIMFIRYEGSQVREEFACEGSFKVHDGSRTVHGL